MVKQASKQGVTEGSLIDLVCNGLSESFFVDKDYEDMEIAINKTCCPLIE